mgnify:FL=1
MRVLTVNAGSSSLRLGLCEGDGAVIRRIAEVKYEGTQITVAWLESFLAQAPSEVEAVAHRVVHGGEHMTSSRLIDAGVEGEIERLAPLAPLHNPPALQWIRACRRVLGDRVPQVAVFDTAFYCHLPAVARAYALPLETCRELGIRRYGFHGIAHQAMWRRWRQLRPDLEDGGRVISLQLGAGCSATAIARGRPLDTSMGFSPLEGLVMATRPGDVDPGAMVYLQRALGWGPNELDDLLNNHSGLLGLSGLSGDMRVLLSSDSPEARLAVELYCYRARKYVGAYMAVLAGADGILFGGGVGEHAPQVRQAILRDMEWCGVALDPEANAAATSGEHRISRADSLDVWVVPVDEAAVLAEEAIRVVSKIGDEGGQM